AGNGDQQMRRVLETVQKSAGCLKGGIIRAGHGVSSVRNQQDRRLCSEETLLFTALEASGSRLFTSRSVAQAVSRLSSAASDMPSFSSISGAFFDLLNVWWALRKVFAASLKLPCEYCASPSQKFASAAFSPFGKMSR